MTKTNPLVEMPDPIEVPTSKKPFNINKAVGSVILGFMLLFCVVYTGQAMFKDPMKETETKLEQGLSKNMLLWNHQKSMNADTRAHLAEGEEQEKLLADPVCDSWKALKAFREANKIPLEHPEVNVCRDVQAPSEVGYNYPAVPGVEGQVLPDPAFR